MRLPPTFWPRLLLAAALLGPAAPAWAQAPGCGFSWLNRGTVFDLGTLDPTRPGAFGLVTSMLLTGTCAPGTRVEIPDGARRSLRGPGGVQLPYQVRLQQQPLAGNRSVLRLEIDLVNGSYGELPAGDYVDTFTITLLP